MTTWVILTNNEVVMTADRALGSHFVEVQDNDSRLLAFNAKMEHPPVIAFNAFLNRIPPLTLMALFTAAQTNPQILAWTSMGAAKNVVDLTAPETAAGLDVLVSAGVIDSALKAQLLTP